MDKVENVTCRFCIWRGGGFSSKDLSSKEGAKEDGGGSNAHRVSKACEQRYWTGTGTAGTETL